MLTFFLLLTGVPGLLPPLLPGLLPPHLLLHQALDCLAALGKVSKVIPVKSVYKLTVSLIMLNLEIFLFLSPKFLNWSQRRCADGV